MRHAASRSTAPGLPARDLATVRFAEMFGEPGCPLCRHRDDAVARYIEGFMYESVNDVAFRASLDAARGFCPPHTHAVLAGGRRVTGGMLGGAILFGAVMRVRLQELRAVQGARSLSRGRRAQDALRPPSCLVCAAGSSADEVAVSSVVRLSVDASWADAIGGADVCLGHLAALMAAPGRPSTWSDIEARQLVRIQALRELVETFAHNSSHDRQHLTLPDQVEAVGRAAAFLAGGAGDARERRHRTSS